MLARLAIAASLAAVTLSGAAGFAQSTYTITDLGNLGYSSYPYAINSSGQIVGVSYSDSYQSDEWAFFYDASPTGAKKMVPLFGGGGNLAYGINNSGQIVGGVLDNYLSTGGSFEFDAYIENINTGTVTPLSFSNSGQINVGGGYTGSNAVAYDINNNGEMAGTVLLPHDVSNTQYGFTCDPSADTGSTFLPPGGTGGWVVSSNAINDSGVYVGTLANSSNTLHEAYYYNPSANGGSGGLVQIHTPVDTSGVSYYANANAINQGGLVVGGADMSTTGNGALSAYVCNINGSGAMVDLGTLGTGDYSQAEGINSSGEIVGYSNLTPGASTYSAFVSNSTGGMTNLNSLLPSNSGWDLEEATAVNDSGWIVGYGINSAGSIDGFLLEPVPVVHNPGQCITSDRVVDINDLTIVLTDFGKTGCAWSQGCMDGDPTGTVDINDLTNHCAG
jgi:probable HAF family extracellular repeat protein